MQCVEVSVSLPDCASRAWVKPGAVYIVAYANYRVHEKPCSIFAGQRHWMGTGAARTIGAGRPTMAVIDELLEK